MDEFVAFSLSYIGNHPINYGWFDPTAEYVLEVIGLSEGMLNVIERREYVSDSLHMVPLAIGSSNC